MLELIDRRAPSIERRWLGPTTTVDGHLFSLIHGRVIPSSTAILSLQPRPSFLPKGGHVFSPLVAANLPAIGTLVLGVLRLGLTRSLGVVSDARKRDHVSMSSTTTVSAYQQACARQLWKVPDRSNIASYTSASSCIARRAWVLNGSQEM